MRPGIADSHLFLYILYSPRCQQYVPCFSLLIQNACQYSNLAPFYGTHNWHIILCYSNIARGLVICTEGSVRILAVCSTMPVVAPKFTQNGFDLPKMFVHLETNATSLANQLIQKEMKAIPGRTCRLEASRNAGRPDTEIAATSGGRSSRMIRRVFGASLLANAMLRQLHLRNAA